MEYLSQNPQMSRYIVNGFVTAIANLLAGKLVNTPNVHLFTASSAPLTPDFTAAQFTEASFAGYALQTPTWSGAIVNTSDEGGLGELATATFVATGVASPGETIIGYWVDDGVGNMVMAEMFPQPFLITAAGDFLVLSILACAIFNPQA